MWHLIRCYHVIVRKTISRDKSHAGQMYDVIDGLPDDSSKSSHSHSLSCSLFEAQAESHLKRGILPGTNSVHIPVLRENMSELNTGQHTTSQKQTHRTFSTQSRCELTFQDPFLMWANFTLSRFFMLEVHSLLCKLSSSALSSKTSSPLTGRALTQDMTI